MKRNNKKGFTLVELLVVIAILAVLASVSVVGYLGFVKKARVSNDSSLVTQMNIALQASEAGGENLDSPHDAMSVLNENGLSVSKLTPTTDGYSYIYDLSNHRMLLVEETTDSFKVSAPEGFSVDSTNKEDYFVFVGDEAEVSTYSDKGWSVYLKDGFSWNNDESKNLNVKSGLDVGDNEGISAINYESNSSTQTSIIRTNSFKTTLTVNDGSDTIHHYGNAMKINITSVSDEAYHEHGEVTNIEIASGKVDIEKDANVKTVVVTGDNVKVDSELSDVNVKVASTVSTVPTVNGDCEVIEGAILVNDEASLESSLLILESELESSSKNVVLSSDISSDDIEKSLIININAKYDSSTDNVYYPKGTIDLNGYTINGQLSITAGNVKIQGSGLIKCDDGHGISIISKSFRKTDVSVIIEDVTVEAKEFAVYFNNNLSTSVNEGNSTVNINSGTFTSYDNAVLGVSGNSYKFGTITVNGGTFNGFIKTKEGNIACGIYACNPSTWQINAGTFNITNGCGILARNGTVTVEKDVVINLNNNQENPATGRVGDGKDANDIYVQVPSDPLVEDHKCTGYGSGGQYIYNNSSYIVTKLTA